MLKRQLDRSLYIDALALVPEKKSGIGYALEQTLLSLANQAQDAASYMIYLVVPLGKAKHLNKYTRQNIKIKTIYLPARLMELLLRVRLFPPADWLLGTGIYLFPNYRNWPLWRSRSLTYVYDMGFIKFPEMAQPKNQRYLNRYLNRWMLRTDKVITITDQMRVEIEKQLNVPYTNIEVAHCGVNLSVFYKRQASEVEAVKKKYGVLFRDYLLFVGNIEPRKNLIALLEAYGQLPAKLREKYALVIIGGDGWLNDKFYRCLQRAQQNGQKIVKPEKYVQTEDLPALYSGATALVHPAIYEGFGITPLEAMACETPIVVSNIPAIREVVQEAAFYCDPFSPESIKEALIEVLTNDKIRKARIIQGKTRAGELTWSETAKTLWQYIDQAQQDGAHRRPIARRLKTIYAKTDLVIRESLGERALDAYRPRRAKDKEDLRTIVYNDFLREQPSRPQIVFLKTYQFAKFVLLQIVKQAHYLIVRTG